MFSPGRRWYLAVDPIAVDQARVARHLAIARNKWREHPHGFDYLFRGIWWAHTFLELRVEFFGYVWGMIYIYILFFLIDTSDDVFAEGSVVLHPHIV